MGQVFGLPKRCLQPNLTHTPEKRGQKKMILPSPLTSPPSTTLPPPSHPSSSLTPASPASPSSTMSFGTPTTVLGLVPLATRFHMCLPEALSA
ncbi:hypothetical protein FH972_012078 [Carpinus fangiana]|uniref:Uncharacterized protein n=1 Tax=Carpinus fangiana TaxID=176857 RepID=A0A5N6R2Q9_9ROSI|nr:hypothetical protein FH972_012078 [Carpinus fangiana]